MKIYFNEDKVVKRLARKLKRQVEAWGDEIYYNTALTVVARAFGHDDYPALYATFGMTDGSLSDAEVDAVERGKRFRQYLEGLSQNDFSLAEAEEVLTKIRVGGWWGFGTERSEQPTGQSSSRASDDELESTSRGGGATVSSTRCAAGWRKSYAGFDEAGGESRRRILARTSVAEI